MDNKKLLVFVYGTLMKCFWNYERLELYNETYVGKGYTMNKGQMFAQYYPYVNFDRENDHIKGEVYLINNDKESVLDMLESEYLRIETDIILTED